MIADGLAIDSNGAYSPREDSYLMAKAVEEHASGKVLDLGTGTGINGIVAARKGCRVTFSDISGMAIECASGNARRNGVSGTFVVSDLFNNIDGKFNTIIFNPPYLPARTEDHAKPDIALDGGIDGRAVIEGFLSSYKDHVEEDHRILLLESSLNDYQQDIKRLDAKVVCSERLFFEELVVLMFR